MGSESETAMSDPRDNYIHLTVRMPEDESTDQVVTRVTKGIRDACKMFWEHAPGEQFRFENERIGPDEDVAEIKVYSVSLIDVRAAQP